MRDIIVLEIIRQQMNLGETFFVPVQMPEVDEYGHGSLESFTLRMLELEDGRVAVAAFTSVEESVKETGKSAEYDRHIGDGVMREECDFKEMYYPMPICNHTRGVGKENVGYTQGITIDGIPFEAELVEIEGKRDIHIIMPEITDFYEEGEDANCVPDNDTVKGLVQQVTNHYNFILADGMVDNQVEFSLNTMQNYLDYNEALKGYGTLKYDSYNPVNVLTKQGETRSKWQLPSFFRELNISYHNNKTNGFISNDYFKSANIGQEFVIEANGAVLGWVKEIISKQLKLD